MLVEKYGWAIRKSSFALTNQDSTFFPTRENWKMFNITSKYFSFFYNKPPATWVAHITRDFLTRYPCSYYSSMIIQEICYAIVLVTAKILIGFPRYLTVLLASDFYFIFFCCGIAFKIELSCKFPEQFCNLRWIRWMIDITLMPREQAC